MTNKYAGTQTEKNLWAAFAGESQARNKYTYFASKAKKEGFEQISEIFTKTAANEKEHAELWFKEFIPNFIISDEIIMDNNGNNVLLKGLTVKDIIYNDYTNLNVQIIDYYNLNLKLFYEEFEYPNPNIKEVSRNSFDILINKLGLISINSTKYNLILKLDKITHFIEYATVYVLDKLKEDNLI